MAKLICLSGLNKGEEFELASGPNAVGRSEKNQICVFDKKVSRHHCTIFVEDENITVVDNNNTNGLKVNNVQVTGPGNLKVGDHIRLGQTVFLFCDRSIKDQDEVVKSKEQENAEFEQLLEETTFQVTKTTALRKLRTDKDGSPTGFLTFFTRQDQDNQQNQNPPG